MLLEDENVSLKWKIWLFNPGSISDDILDIGMDNE